MGIVSVMIGFAAPATRRVELRALLWREHCLEHGACLQPQQLLVGNRLAQRLRREIARPAKVIATGGLATLFEHNTDVFDVIEADLTIQGLAMMWDRHHI